MWLVRCSRPLARFGTAEGPHGGLGLVVDAELTQQAFYVSSYSRLRDIQIAGDLLVGRSNLTMCQDQTLPFRRSRRADVLEFFRNPPRCLVGIEACGTAHHWAREITALGHEAKLPPPSYVKPYVKRGKTGAADAEAFCEAVTRPGMRFVPVKMVARQSVLMLHRTRDLLVRQRTMLINAIRAHMAELGYVTAQGKCGIGDLMAMILGEHAARLPDIARDALKALACSLEELGKRVKEVEVSIVAWHRNDETSRRLATIPGVGPITASAIVAEVTDQGQFRSSRHFAAWCSATRRMAGQRHPDGWSLRVIRMA
jgi:transposase